MREFIDTVDRATPPGEGAFARQRVIDSTLEMADRLVDLQHAFVRSVVRAAGRHWARQTVGSEDAWVTRSSSAHGRSRCEVLVGSRVRRELAVGALARCPQVYGRQRGTVVLGEDLRCSW